MANLEGFKKSFDNRLSRYFSEKFKKDMVKRVENNEFSVREISGLYGVSTTAVYKWVINILSCTRKDTNK